jgi:hypothetical protein
MTKKLPVILFILAFTGAFALSASAQKSGKSVTASEVTGTYRHNFTGKFRKTSSEIRIRSIGKGRLKIAFDLVYPIDNGSGELSANTGTAEGNAAIKGDTAVYSSNEFGPCSITIKFVRPSSIRVTQNGTDTDCGFGHNVSADGVYKKVSSAKPKF